MQLKEEIKRLAQLQDIDKKIYQLTLEKENIIPEKIEGIKELIDKKKSEFSAFKDRVNRIELDKKSKEGELEAKEESLKKAKSQLYQLKSNKEYQVKLKEIASIEADISCAEEEVIEILEIIDVEKEKVNKEKGNVDVEAERLSQKSKEWQGQLEELEEKINSLKNKRRHYTEGIDKKILNQYESLLKKRSGLAIVPVKNDNCGACHINVTHQKINEIKMYDRLVLCESCVRIIYIPEDLELCV